MHLATGFDKYALCCMPLWWGLAPKPAPQSCATSFLCIEPQSYLCVHKKHNTHGSMTSSPATLCRLGRGYAELWLNGVLRSSTSAFKSSRKSVKNLRIIGHLRDALYVLGLVD